MRDQWRKPADFEFQADDNEEVGSAKFEQKAGFGFDEVWVLVAAGDRFDFDSVAADLLRECRQVRCGVHYV